MKKTFIATATVIFLSGTLAHAGYLCQSVPHGATLKVQKQSTRLGDTVLLLQHGSEESYYHGKLQSEGGPMLGKEVIHIYPYNSGDTLTIVSKPKSCGRGFCDPDNDKIIKAILQIGYSETTFYCNETQN